MSPHYEGTVLITGASRKAGIGAAIARALARDWGNLFITYYRPYDHTSGLVYTPSPDDAGELLAELRGLGRRAEGLEVDLSDPTAPARLFDAVERTLGPVHVLINNATYSMQGGIDALTAEQLDRTYAVNLRGMALLCVEFVRRFRAAAPPPDGGRIINLTSGQSLGPMPGELAYVATKGAVEAFTLSLSAEVAPLGITVNAVDPGVTDTGWIAPELKAKWEAEAPQGRLGQPDDAARLIRFLASPDAGWVTGQVIHSHGGIRI
ncbi:MAG: SDR family oxidoreductase [Anaerolineae bacterium]|jgi:3-oxoacyl-[acyl-carrier protein] reductase|nr:SDR family oxidoreductase [Anaerolineae bacterium]